MKKRAADNFILYKNLLNSLPVGAALIGIRGGILSWNKKTTELFYKEEQEVIGTKLVNLFPEREKEKLQKFITSSFSLTKKHQSRIFKIQTIKKKIKYLEVTSSKIEDGLQDRGLIMVFQDITARVIAERIRKEVKKELQESEKQYKTLVEMAPDIIYSTSGDNAKITSLNPAFETITGWKTLKWMGKSFTEITHFDDVEEAIERYRYKKISSPYEIRIRTKAGSYITGEFRSMPKVKKGKISGRIGIIRDVTKRKKDEQELKFQKSLLESQSEASKDGILFVSKDRKIISYNKRFVELTGIPKEIVTEGSSIKATEYLKTKVVNSEEYINRVNHLYNNFDEDSNDEVYFKDGRILDRYGTSIKYNGEYFGRVWFFRDITERKELERRKDEFIGIATHELKTPLTTVKAFTQILQKRFMEIKDEKSLNYLSKMNLQINKLTELVKDLLDASKIDAGKLDLQYQKFNIKDLIKDTVENLQETTDKHKISVKNSLIQNIYADKERVGQVLTNLLSNAIKYSPYKGNIIVNSTKTNNMITISVKDFGIGISKENYDKVFERFVQIKSSGNETMPSLGLGLYISSEIIKRHGGNIWLESNKDKGTTFFFTLPIKIVNKTK